MTYYGARFCLAMLALKTHCLRHTMNSLPVKTCCAIFCAFTLQSTAQAEHNFVGESSDVTQQDKTLTSYVVDLIKPVAAEPYWYVQGSVYTKHFKHNPEHNNNQELIGLERHTENSYLFGAATFLHSFDQRSYYGYVGKRFDYAGTPFYSKLTAGLLYGYKGEYRDKIPLNRFGVAPAIIPSVGVRYRRVGAEIVLLGTAATMINIGFEL